MLSWCGILPRLIGNEFFAISYCIIVAHCDAEIATCNLQEAGGVLEKLETEVTEQQKVNIKAQSDCRSFSDTLKSTRGELQRLEKQAASVIILLLFRPHDTVPIGIDDAHSMVCLSDCR